MNGFIRVNVTEHLGKELEWFV